MIETKSLADEIKREHVFVRGALDQIDEELGRFQADSDPMHHGGKLLGMLAMFRLHLVRHFELEEQGGLLVDRAEWNPGIRRTVQRLVEEHRRMETTLASLMEDLESVACGQAGLTDVFQAELTEFLTLIRAHERTENELAQEIVCRDVGAGD